jgi:hypothetical protein
MKVRHDVRTQSESFIIPFEKRRYWSKISPTRSSSPAKTFSLGKRTRCMGTVTLSNCRLQPSNRFNKLLRKKNHEEKRPHSHSAKTLMHSGSTRDSCSMGTTLHEITVFTRSRSGDKHSGLARGDAPAVALSLSRLQSMFKFPLHEAASRIGVCCTVLKRSAYFSFLFGDLS